MRACTRATPSGARLAFPSTEVVSRGPRVRVPEPRPSAHPSPTRGAPPGAGGARRGGRGPASGRSRGRVSAVARCTNVAGTTTRRSCNGEVTEPAQTVAYIQPNWYTKDIDTIRPKVYI